MPTTLTMSGLVTAVTTGLRATALTCPVEEYWRVEPPAVMTCFVQPKQETPEKSPGIGNAWVSGFSLDIIIEAPWDDKVATGQSLSAAVEIVKSYIAANRALITDGAVDYVTRYEAITYQFVQRPGAGKPAFVAVVPLLVQWPR